MAIDMSTLNLYAAVSVFLCLTNIATGARMITVDIDITWSDPDCVGGNVGLTSTSVLVQYRLYSPPQLERWNSLGFLLKPPASTNLPFTSTVPSDSPPEGVQLRFLQFDHGGEGCNCWEVIKVELSYTDPPMNPWMTTVNNISTVKCFSRGLRERFCHDFANEFRGVFTQVFFFINDPGNLTCPGISSDALVSSGGPALPENCNMMTPRM